VELHGAIMCASAPALKVFFKQYLRLGTNKSNSTPPRSVTLIAGSGRPQDSEKAMNYTNGSYGTETEVTIDPNEKTIWFDRTIDVEVENRFAHKDDGNDYNGNGGANAFDFGFNSNGNDHSGFNYENTYASSGNPSTTTSQAVRSNSIPIATSFAGSSPQRIQNSSRPPTRGEAGFGLTWLSP
jgi:hypothetical protein